MSLERDGFELRARLIEPGEVERLRRALEGSGHGRRGLLAVPEVRALTRLMPGLHPVRGILFDKLPGANWKVPWHQDVTVAVRERRDVEGFRNWTVKDGIPHVHPPVEVLEGMVALRLSLDDCTPANGPLRVVPGSHRRGRLPKPEVLRLGHSGPEVVCCVPAGGAVLMRPLLIHASSKAERPGHRRVIHLEFASGILPGGLEWADA